VGEVSDRTRVREIIIEAIEQDDYAPCGGDFYARGHIRAIAGMVGTDPEPLIEEFDERWGSSPELTAAEVFEPGIPLRQRERHRVRWLGVLAVLVLAVLGFAVYKLVSGVSPAQHAAAASSPGPGQGGTPAAASASAPSVQAGTGQASNAQGSTAQGSPTATSSAQVAAPQGLTPDSVAAFGPGGTASGDDPQRAALALGDDSASPWYSDWYTTANFGNLQSGTGLLLDMGRPVTVTSVRLSLGHIPGTDLELRVGDTPALADLHRVAGSSGAAGSVQMSVTAPVHARYLLIWFTRLPPDPSGTCQVSVYQIRVQGRP